MGKQEVWLWIKRQQWPLEQPGATEHFIDITDGESIQWWLWVSTLEQSHGSVVGPGIKAVTVTSNGCSRALFRFSRVDGSTCQALLSYDARDKLKVLLGDLSACR